jgi:hypothetical protein
MFDIYNEQRIAKLIDGRIPNSFVEPLYVKIYNDRYGIDELNDITDFNPSAFKVGFGSSLGLFIRNPINMKDLIGLDVVNKFKLYKEDLQCEHVYYIFEIGIFGDFDNALYQQMEYYYKELRKHIEDRCNEIKKERIRKLMEENM